MLFIRLIRFLLYLFVPAPLPDTSEADLFRAPSSAEESNVEVSDIRPTPIEGEIIWNNKPLIEENPIRPAFDGPTLLFRTFPDSPSSNTSHYRDEDGESRPVRLDCSGLGDAMLEDLAAEYLYTKTDADAAPDALERDLIAALRDTYSRELWLRAQRGAQHVHADGRDYRIVPRGDGFVELITTA